MNRATPSLEWPDHYPDGCPPSIARPRSENVFVFVRRRRPTGADFRSKHDRGWRPEEGADSSEHCRACGVSVSPTLTDAQELQKLIPFFAKLRIAAGPPTPGVVASTHGPFPQLNHMTWWIPRGATPWRGFNVQGGA